MPSQGRAGPARRPLGNHVVRGSALIHRWARTCCPGRAAGEMRHCRRNSEPIPIELSLGVEQRRPAEIGIGGEVKIALSSRYSHAPTNSLRSTTKHTLCRPAASRFASRTWVLTPILSEDPRGCGCDIDAHLPRAPVRTRSHGHRHKGGRNLAPIRQDTISISSASRIR